MRDNPDLNFEIPLWQSGQRYVAGLDEAGRGAWAGPVSAAAVILPSNPNVLPLLQGIRDSKQMSAAQREIGAAKIKVVALAWGVGFASQEEIDLLGIVPATRLAMQRALARLHPEAEHLLIDAVRLPGVALPQTSLIKGDARCLSIAAASVLAKTARDARMVELNRLYPGYGFARHKGYGTGAHQEALEQLGVCTIHRRTFAPVQARLQESVDSGEEGKAKKLTPVDTV